MSRAQEHWEVQEMPGQEPGEDGVVLLVKQYMCHTFLSQQPTQGLATFQGQICQALKCKFDVCTAKTLCNSEHGW